MAPIKVLITHQKGGVGKSTIAANLAAYLAIQNHSSTCLLDFDKQGSSAKWIANAPDMGVTVYRPEMDYQQHGKPLYAQFRRELNRYSQTHDISLSDLTWSPSLSPELLLEFDIILIPTALSKFDIASSEIFVLEYLNKYLEAIQKRQQAILVVPSKVAKNFNPQQSFLNLTSVQACSIAPPVQFVPTMDELVYDDFLCVSQDSEVAQNFSTFGQHVAELIHHKIKQKQNIQRTRPEKIGNLSNLTLLEQFVKKRKESLAQKNILDQVVDQAPEFLERKKIN